MVYFRSVAPLVQVHIIPVQALYNFAFGQFLLYDSINLRVPNASTSPVYSGSSNDTLTCDCAAR
jgi:hypothetical protein